MLENRTVIFTDGASRGNPGPGGWGVVVVYFGDGVSEQGRQADGRVAELGGRKDGTTNNCMELTAAAQAIGYYLDHHKDPGERPVTVYTDSRYLINGITKWVWGWQKNGWRTKGGEPVLNQELWQWLFRLSSGLDINWQYVSGHAGIAGNERADHIATALADGRDPELFSGPLSAYSLELRNLAELSTNTGSEQKARATSRGKPYSYVSLVDGEIETHNSWPDCQARVHGVKGAKFKKVFSSQEEQELIKKWQGEN